MIKYPPQEHPSNTKTPVFIKLINDWRVSLYDYLSGRETSVDARLDALEVDISASAVLTSNQSIAASTHTKINFDSKEWDTGGDFSTSLNRFISPIDGKIRISGVITYRVPSDLKRKRVHIYKNGVETKAVYQMSSGTPYQSVQFNFVLDLTAGDYVEVYGYAEDGDVIDSDLSVFQIGL